MNSFGDFTRDWPNLPWDPLFRIIESSLSLSDYIRFGAVCIQWRLFYVQNYDRINELFSRRPPLFLYSPKEDRSLKRKRETSTGRVSSFLDRKAYNDVQFPSLLLNPFFTRSSSTAAAAKKMIIQLPPLFQITDWSAYNFDYPNKVVLSACPLSNPKSFVAMALIRGNVCLSSKLSSGLGFCRPGDSAWTSLPFEGKVFDDIVYYKGKFYIVEDSGALISIDFGDCFPHSDNEPKIARIIVPCPRTVVHSICSMGLDGNFRGSYFVFKYWWFHVYLCI